MQKITSHTVVFSNGKEENPYGKKSKIIQKCTLSQNQQFITVDDSDCSNTEERVTKLRELVDQLSTKIVLVGSRMGGYVSTVVANSKPVDGLFLIAPALYMPDYAVQEYEPLTKNITVRHGWEDDIIPFNNPFGFVSRSNTLAAMMRTAGFWRL